MADRVRSFLIPAGEGEVLRGPAGGPATIKARTETTNGTFTALEVAIAPGQGPPQHTHMREDEMYYVLGGAVRFKADDELFDAAQGSFMFIPRGTVHAFRNYGDAPARLLVMFTPAGMERYFELVAQTPADQLGPQTLARASEAAWMTIVGPPLA